MDDSSFKGFHAMWLCRAGVWDAEHGTEVYKTVHRVAEVEGWPEAIRRCRDMLTLLSLEYRENLTEIKSRDAESTEQLESDEILTEIKSETEGVTQ